MGPLLPRRPPHGDVTQIPTPPLQAAAVFINFFFPAMALVLVALRSYSRIKTRQWGLDDYLICTALLFALAMAGPFYLYVKLNYFGWRMADVPQFDPAPGLWWFYVAQLLYNPVLALVKASVLVFLLRLGSQSRNIRYCIYALNAFNGLQAVAIFLVALLQCLPISANWDFEAKAKAKCVDNSFHVTISSLTIFTDILVVALPLWIVWGLKMRPAVKIAVMVVFLMGLAVTVISIVRLVSLVRMFYGPMDTTGDPYHNIGIMYNVVEVNVAIVAASAPALRPLFRSWMPRLFGDSTGKYLSGKQSGLQYGNSYFAGTGRVGTGTGTGGGIGLKSMRTGASRSQHTECRSISPSGSEEEIMTYNGILRTTQVQLKFEDNKQGPVASRPSREDMGIAH